MSTSHKPPPTSPAAHSSHDAWQRWMPLWYATFYVALLLSLLLSQRDEQHLSGPFVSILGLTILLAIWYGFCMMPRFQHLKQYVWLSTVYLLVGWGLWFGLTLLDPSYMYLLFGLYPQIFMFRLLPWKI